MDDESLGCGGLLAKFPDECLVVTVAAGDETRTREHAEALRILGVTRHLALDLPDTRLDEHMPELVGRLDAVMAQYRPDEVYVPSPSLHQDHIATYEAGMRSARISMTAGHWYPPAVFVYDISVYDLDLYPRDLRWNVFEELTEQQADAKAAACLAYQSEVPSDLHPITAVKQLAAATGRTRLVAFAEQYALVRQVRR